MKIIATNRRAQFDFFVEEELTVGLILTGSETKALVANQCSINEAYVQSKDGELWLIGCHMNVSSGDPTRTRKLLANKREIDKLAGKVQMQGYTIVPMNLIYSSTKKFKLVVGLAKGKKQHDKRQTIKERDLDREARRNINKQKGEL